MATEYLDFNKLRADYPVAVDLIDRENAMQCPHAKFIRARVGIYEPDDTEFHMMALFDCGTPEKLLWVWIPGVNDPYIDEYYEVPMQDANRYLDEVT